MLNRLSVCVLFVLGMLAPAAHAILPIQHWETTRGARVYFVENRDLPMLDLSVEFPAGAGFDSPESSGVANMTNHMLRLGAGGLDEDEIARRLADVGAQLSGRFNSDRAGLGLRTLSSKAERAQALDLFSRVLAQPAFPESVLEREKARLVSALKEADTRPDTIAAVTFNRMIYRGHPYGLRSSGEVATVQKIIREDLARFHRTHYTVQHAVVALIGDLSREEAAGIAEAVTKDLPNAAGAAPQLPPVVELPEGSVRWIRHHASQSHILIGAPGMRRDDPDYFALFVGNHILGGGGFVSRITEEVRQKRGLAYSAYSYFSPLARRPFVIGMQTAGDTGGRGARGRAQDAARVHRANGPDRGGARGGQEEHRRRLSAAHRQQPQDPRLPRVIGFYRLPLTYLDDFVKNVERVTLEEIRGRLSQKRVRPGRMVTVVVAPVAEKQARSPRRHAKMPSPARMKARNRVRIIGGLGAAGICAFRIAPGLRPSPDRVRETLFNWLGQDLTGCECLDLFAGSGALGFEAASRGARRVVMVEQRRACVPGAAGECARLLGAGCRGTGALRCARIPARRPGIRRRVPRSAFR
jgi:zinc protease